MNHLCFSSLIPQAMWSCSQQRNVLSLLLLWSSLETRSPCQAGGGTIPTRQYRTSTPYPELLQDRPVWPHLACSDDSTEILWAVTGWLGEIASQTLSPCPDMTDLRSVLLWSFDSWFNSILFWTLMSTSSISLPAWRLQWRLPYCLDPLGTWFAPGGGREVLPSPARAWVQCSARLSPIPPPPLPVVSEKHCPT